MLNKETFVSKQICGKYRYNLSKYTGNVSRYVWCRIVILIYLNNAEIAL